MALSDSAYPPVFQRFLSKNGEPLASLPTKTCSQSGKRYIFWSDIQNIFEDVVFLKDLDGLIVLFMIDQDGELYVSFHEEMVQAASKINTKSHFPTSILVVGVVLCASRAAWVKRIPCFIVVPKDMEPKDPDTASDRSIKYSLPKQHVTAVRTS